VIIVSLYLLFSLLAFIQLRLAYKTEKTYRSPSLYHYFIYLTFFFIYGFIKYIGYIFVLEFERFEKAVMVTQVALLIFPFFALALYAMMQWTRNLTEKATPLPLKITYWTVQCALFAYMVFHKVVDPEKTDAAPARLWPIIHNAETIILFAIIIQLFFLPAKIKKKKKRQFILSLGSIYLISFAFFEAFQQLGVPYLTEDAPTYFRIAGVLFFCVNIPALFYILRFIRLHHREMAGPPLSTDEMTQFCMAYDITPREKEIIESIILGKTNKEIGNSLHISIQTVKNINYNLYKKVGIKNRLQLLNLIHEFGKTEKG
jgi:DNA-binding CsgD family transcriptional regulator